MIEIIKSSEESAWPSSTHDVSRFKLWGGQGKLNSFSRIREAQALAKAELLSSRNASYVSPHLFAQSIQLQLAVLSLTALRMHLVQSVVFIIILRCSFHIICKIIHMSRFSFQLLCLSLTRRVSPPALACHKSQPNERPDRWKQKTLRITFQWKQQNSSR